MLLILLFGNHLEYIQLLSGEQISSSQRFLPRLSSIGLDEKSSSQVSDDGNDAVEFSVSKSISEIASGTVEGPTSASAISALHNKTWECWARLPGLPQPMGVFWHLCPQKNF